MTEFEMSREQLEAIFEAIKPVPYMVIGGIAPKSQQERANDAWKALGDELGFDHITVRPSGRGDRFFFAAPKDTP